MNYCKIMFEKVPEMIAVIFEKTITFCIKTVFALINKVLQIIFGSILKKHFYIFFRRACNCIPRTLSNSISEVMVSCENPKNFLLIIPDLQ